MMERTREGIDFIEAPFSSEQVDALNRYQRLGYVHEFTCPEHHGGADRTLYATKDGWRCPHCAYQQDWAHRAMLNATPIEKLIKLSCDVMLPPATLIRKGCDLSVLMTAMNERANQPPEECRFNDPAKLRERINPLFLKHQVTVQANDYSYAGEVCGYAVKASGEVRYIVEDSNGRLFIHSHTQIGKEEGWKP